jgi:hypothetical protein
MHLLCKQADVGVLPTDSTSHCPLRVSGQRLPAIALAKAGFNFILHGYGWQAISLRGE